MSSSEHQQHGAVDEALYSRQLYVMGHEAQHKLSRARVLVAGLTGVGVELCKNIVLAGVHHVSVLDHTLVQIADLGAQFYLRPEHVGRVSRAHASLAPLRELNPYVHVEAIEKGTVLEVLTASSSSSTTTTTTTTSPFTVVVATNLPFAEQAPISAFCHAHNIAFIGANAHGLFSSVFVDCGRAHVVSDATGEQPLRGLISHVSSSNPGVVTCHDESRHGLSTGDHVVFEEVPGMVELNDSAPRPVKVLTPFSFSIEDTTAYHPYNGHKGYFQQVKMPVTLSTQPLAAQLHHPSLLHEFDRERMLHVLQLALSSFYEQHKRAPRPHTWADADQVVQLALAAVDTLPRTHSDAALPSRADVEAAAPWLRRLARIAACELSPMAALVGGIAGQEVLKVASGKFMPIVQFLYYDASHALPRTSAEAALTEAQLAADYAPQSSRYDHQIGVYGRALQQHLESLSYFVVGAGAIGCEMLKNFALMGVGTRGRACVHVTDMDVIEKSNLNRQFLFRSTDVGQLKSTTAAREAQKMNPSMHISSRNLRVSAATEDVYNDAFFQSLDGVVTALDNVDARLYVDQRCIFYQRPMIDSGTLGTKGSVQVVVPFLTESYGSSRDPPEDSIPICTLKNFPNKIEHTIQWARDMFEGTFAQGPTEANAFLSDRDAYVRQLAEKPHEQLTNLQVVRELLVDGAARTYADCVVWARRLFESEFNSKIRQLLHVFPPDSLTQEGAPFWSGPKRAPVPLTFSSTDPLCMSFIRAAAALRAFVFGIAVPASGANGANGANDAVVSSALASVVIPEWKPDAKAKIATTDAEAKQQQEEQANAMDDHEQQVQHLLEALERGGAHTHAALHPVEFEKDDDSNSHIAFINACSNLRARNYTIKEVTAHETKFIAGKIIPAIATTTAAVTGLVCIELYKLALKLDRIEDYRTSSLNLALPFFTSSEPLPPSLTSCQLKGKEWKWSLWDRLDIDHGRELTLEEFLAYMKDEYALEVSMLGHGAAMLYYNFGMSKKKLKERLAMPLSVLVADVTKQALNPHASYLVLEASVNDAEDNEISIPSIRYRFRW